MQIRRRNEKRKFKQGIEKEMTEYLGALKKKKKKGLIDLEFKEEVFKKMISLRLLSSASSL